MERKSSKEYSVVFLVEGEKFIFAFEDFIFVVGSAANSVGTALEFSAFGSGPNAKYSRASAFCFFCPQPWYLRRSKHIFLGKVPACSCRSASCRGKKKVA